jgi:hypothetical protein
MAWQEPTESEMDGAGEYEGLFWEPWKEDSEIEIPNPVQGVVEESKIGKHNKLFLKIRDSDDRLWITNQHAVLHRQIKALNIEDGEEVHLEYLGEEPTEGGLSPKKNYRLRVWRE